METCKRQGLKIEKKTVSESIVKVQEFFFLGKSFGGKMFDKKSTNKVQRKKKDSGDSELQEQLVRFSDERCEENALVVSCDQPFANELFKSFSEDFLKVDSVDLNTRSFSKELGKLFLCDTFTVFLETSNLRKTGIDRLHAIIDMIKSLFDNRVRVILYGSSMCESRSEKRFENISERSGGDRSVGDSLLPKGLLVSQLEKAKQDNEDISHKLEKAVQENQDVDHKLEKALQEKQDVYKKLEKAMQDKQDVNHKLEKAMQNIQDVNQKLQEAIMEREDINKMLEKALTEKNQYYQRLGNTEQEKRDQYKLLEKALTEKEELDEMLDSALQEHDTYYQKSECLKAENLQLKSLNPCQASSVSGNLIPVRVEVETQTPPANFPSSASTKESRRDSQVHIDQACQTKTVDVTPSCLSNIISRIEKDQSRLIADKVFRCIRNFSCKVVNIKNSAGRFSCKVNVTKGKNIMNLYDLLEFEAEGETMGEAKEAAFDLFVARIRAEADK